MRPDMIRPTGVNHVEKKGETTLVFPFFPVGRAKFLGKRSLDAAHISPGEICGLTRPAGVLRSKNPARTSGRRPTDENFSRIPPLQNERLDFVRMRFEELVAALTRELPVFGAKGDTDPFAPAAQPRDTEVRPP